MQFKNILIFNPFGIGDVIFSTPIIKALRLACPGCVINYICNKRVYALLKDNPAINKVIIFEKDDFRNLSKKSKFKFMAKLIEFLKKVKLTKADLMIDLSLNYHAALIAKLLGIRKRIGFNYRNRGKFLTERIKLEGFIDKHVVFYYLDILKLINVGYDNISPELFTSRANDEWAEDFINRNNLSDKLLVGVITGGGRSWGGNALYRRWPVANFAHISDRLRDELGASVILFGDRKEVNLCNEMQSYMKKDVINLGGKTDLGKFMSLIRKCRFVLCNEGGPLHIAVALGVPAISIFGPVDEKVYGPFSTDMSKYIIVTQNVECRPCYLKFKHKKCEHLRCLKTLSEEKIFKAAKTILEKIKNNEQSSIKT